MNQRLTTCLGYSSLIVFMERGWDVYELAYASFTAPRSNPGSAHKERNYTPLMNQK